MKISLKKYHINQETTIARITSAICGSTKLGKKTSDDIGARPTKFELGRQAIRDEAEDRFAATAMIEQCVHVSYAGQAHLREAVIVHEESQRLQRMCRELKKREHLSSFLFAAHSVALTAYEAALNRNDLLCQSLDPPPIIGRNVFEFPRSDRCGRTGGRSVGGCSSLATGIWFVTNLQSRQLFFFGNERVWHDSDAKVHRPLSL